MNRWFTLALIGLAGMLAGCGSSATSSSKPGSNDVYSVAVSPTQLTLNAGDWPQVSATVDLSHLNSAPKPISPQPAIVFLTSDTRVNVSPSGQVCAGQWDSEYQTCSMPAGTTPPTGYVYITANDPTHNVSNTIQLSVHQRAASITLTAPGWTAGTACLTENTELKYDATPLDANGNKITNVYDNDYTWSVADPSVAAISTYGYVLARNPGVTERSASPSYSPPVRPQPSNWSPRPLPMEHRFCRRPPRLT